MVLQGEWHLVDERSVHGFASLLPALLLLALPNEGTGGGVTGGDGGVASAATEATDSANSSSDAEQRRMSLSTCGGRTRVERNAGTHSHTVWKQGGRVQGDRPRLALSL